MNDDKEILPDRFEVRRDTRTGESIQIVFANSKESRTIVIARSQVALFANYLLREAGVELTPDMHPEALKTGGLIEPAGRDLKWSPDGSAILTVHLHTPDGIRSMPIVFSADEAKELGRSLSWSPDSEDAEGN